MLSFHVRSWGGAIPRQHRDAGRGSARRGRSDPEGTTGRTATVWERDAPNDDPTVLLPAQPPIDADADLDAPTRRAQPIVDGPTVELPDAPAPVTPAGAPADGFAGFDEVLPSVLADAAAERRAQTEATQNVISGVTRTLPRDPDSTVPGASSEGPTRILRPPGYLGPEAATVRTPISGGGRAAPAVRRRRSRRSAFALSTETKSGLAGLVVGLAVLVAILAAVGMVRSP